MTQILINNITLTLPLPKPTHKPVDLPGPSIAACRKQAAIALQAGNSFRDPVSGRVCGYYFRGITSGQRATLKALADKGGDKQYVHISKFTKGRDREVSKLRYWGLVQAQESDATGTVVRGMWSLTNLGIRWIKGEVSIPRQVIILLNQFVGFVDEKDRVYIHEIPDAPFSKEKLLKGDSGVK
jgi:hypothetical protein